MLSAVSKSKGIVTVRARSRKHLVCCLERAFGINGPTKFPPVESPRECLDAATLDYRWRIKLHQREWHVLVAALAADVMDYGNFKDAAHAEWGGGNYHSSLTRIWLEMRELQEREILLEDRLAFCQYANGDTGILLHGGGPGKLAEHSKPRVEKAQRGATPQKKATRKKGGK
jgi:hypothetical protein